LKRNCNTLKIDGQKFKNALSERGKTFSEWGMIIGKSTGYISSTASAGVISVTAWEYLCIKLKEMGMPFTKEEADGILLKEKKLETEAKEYEVVAEEEGDRVVVTLYHNGEEVATSYGYTFYDGVKGWLQAYSYAVHMMYKKLFDEE